MISGTFLSCAPTFNYISLFVSDGRKTLAYIQTRHYIAKLYFYFIIRKHIMLQSASMIHTIDNRVIIFISLSSSKSHNKPHKNIYAGRAEVKCHCSDYLYACVAEVFMVIS